MMDKMICPQCNEEITELIWWENSQSTLDLESMETDGIEDKDWEFDCPLCDSDISYCDWVKEIICKLYGGDE